MDQVTWARELAEQLLADPLPRRWSHVQGVGRKAQSIAHIVGDNAETLVCAAWLHDIGYAPELIVTGLHSLDGARYLRDAQAADIRICSLVANHSGAIVEADHRGLRRDLAHEFPVLNRLLADALTYCDMTTDPDGNPTQVQARLSEILQRYEEGSVVSRSIMEASADIARSVAAVAEIVQMQPSLRPGAAADPHKVSANHRQEQPGST